MERFESYYPLFNGIQLALAIMDEEGRFIDINKTYHKLLGFEKNELLGKTPLEVGIISQNELDVIAVAFTAANQVLSEYEISFRTKAKSLRWGLFSVNPLEMEGKRYLVVSINDITEKKQAEKKSAQSSIYLQKITSNVLGMVYEYEILHDRTMKAKFVSDGSFELLGLTSDQLMNDISLLWKAVHPNDLKDLQDSMKAANLSESIWEHEYRFRQTNGTYKWILVRSLQQEKTPLGETIRVGTLVDISNRKNAEEAQKISDLRLRQTIELTPNVAISWFNVRGEVVYWNAASEKMYGYEKSEAMGKTIDQLGFTKEEAESFLQLVSELDKSNKTHGPLETTVKTKQGKIKTVLSTYFTIRGNDKEPILVFMDFDISDQKKNEDELLKTNQLLQTLLNSIPVMVCWKDSNSIYKGANDLFLQLPKLSNEKDIVGKTDMELFGEEFANLFTEYDQQVMRSGQAKQFYEDPFTDRQGERGWLMKSKTPLKDANGKVTGILVTGQDITERKRIELALAAREKRLRSLIEQSPLAIIEWTKDLEILEWNPAAEKIFGYKEEEVTSALFFDKMVSENDRNKANALWKVLLSEYQPDKWILENVRKSGEIMICEWNNSPLTDDDGNCIGILSIVEDISERRKSENDLNQKNEELTKINKELDKFVYSASHDLRAPIASLLGLIQVAKMEKNKEGIFHFLDKQKVTLRKMDEFIHEIVNYSRNGRLAVSKDLIDFKTMISDLFDQYHYVEKASSVEKRVNISNELPFYSDNQRLGVILSNLISNGLKYADMSKAYPFLQIDIVIEKDKATILVKDNGEGILPDYLDKIFNMFLRASSNSTGSGLGLYIVKEVIEKLEGSIEVVSELGQGSEFKVIIPNLP